MGKWVSYRNGNYVEGTGLVANGNYYFKDAGANKYIASPTSNKFIYGDKAVCSVNENGVLVVNSRYLVKNSSYYRMYTSIGSYKPFFVYKVGSGGGQTSTTTLNLDPTNEADQGETTVVKNPIFLWISRMSFSEVAHNPQISKVPDEGLSNVAIICIRVVLPAPLGPRSPNTVPSFTSKLTPFTVSVSLL